MDRVPPQPARSPKPAREAREARTFDLDDVDPPDAVEIDRQRYRLRTSTQLSIIEKAALNRAWIRMSKIEGKLTKGQAPTEADQNEYLRLSREIVSLALPDAPPELVAGLTGEQLDQVIVTFFARTATRSGLVRTISELAATSGTPSRGSSMPMGATH